jgi:transcriptional regulator with XRE-family HTH domain
LFPFQKNNKIKTMKDRSDIKTILGLTQNEMGMLLGVTRGSWTMFKSGLRDIPLTAKTKLAHLMEAAYKREKSCKEIDILLKEEIKNEKIALKQELLATDLKIKRVTKEIENLIRIRENLFAAYETAVILDSENSNPTSKLLADSIKRRVENALKKYNLATLTALELKKENLEMLKLKITKKLKL